MLPNSGNDVAILEASNSGQTSRLDIESQYAVVAFKPETGHDARGDGDRCESEVGTEDRPTDHHRLNMGVDGIHRNRITNGLSRRSDGHIDTDYMTRQINEGTSTIAGVDGGISLDQSIECLAVRGEYRTVYRADNTNRDGRASLESEGVADCDD